MIKHNPENEILMGKYEFYIANIDECEYYTLKNAEFDLEGKR